MKLYHGSDKIITMPKWGHKSGCGDFGDGFYATESDELGREWASACIYGGFLNTYELDTEGLKIIDLSGDLFSIKDWAAFICLNRPGFITQSQMRSKERIMSSALPILKDADVIKGYRADDSNLSFLRDYLSGSISDRELEYHLQYSGTGEQVCLRTEKAFERLKFKEASTVNGGIYYPQRMMRDLKAVAFFSSVKTGGICDLNKAYERYDHEAIRCLGEFTGYVSCVSDISSPDNALDIFSISRYAHYFEEGDPKIICGVSGIEMHHKMMEEAGLGRDDWPEDGYDDMEYSIAYKAGCALASYQRISGMSFADILSSISFSGIMSLCEESGSDADKRSDVTIDDSSAARRTGRSPLGIEKKIALRIEVRKPSSTDLQTRRKRLDLSQKDLSELSGVNLRTLQQYETKDKDINHAAAATVYSLSRALFCPVSRLFER